MLDGATPPSPPSTPDSHIKDCLVAFKAKSGIDLLRHVDALKHRDLTPNVIPKVPHDHLASLLGISEGKTLLYQQFCSDWSARLMLKLAAHT
ncbi:hypothetical protein BN14_12065 [Rhizoctonia solani AG-1 IB]|nr:hypothetical protein BN14_12065 [Rhizoctonia solani AG-1 IB]